MMSRTGRIAWLFLLCSICSETAGRRRNCKSITLCGETPVSNINLYSICTPLKVTLELNSSASFADLKKNYSSYILDYDCFNGVELEESYSFGFEARHFPKTRVSDIDTTNATNDSYCVFSACILDETKQSFCFQPIQSTTCEFKKTTSTPQTTYEALLSTPSPVLLISSTFIENTNSPPSYITIATESKLSTQPTSQKTTSSTSTGDQTSQTTTATPSTTPVVSTTAQLLNDQQTISAIIVASAAFAAVIGITVCLLILGVIRKYTKNQVTIVTEVGYPQNIYTEPTKVFDDPYTNLSILTIAEPICNNYHTSEEQNIPDDILTDTKRKSSFDSVDHAMIRSKPGLYHYQLTRNSLQTPEQRTDESINGKHFAVSQTYYRGSDDGFNCVNAVADQSKSKHLSLNSLDETYIRLSSMSADYSQLSPQREFASCCSMSENDREILSICAFDVEEQDNYVQ